MNYGKKKRKISWIVKWDFYDFSRSPPRINSPLSSSSLTANGVFDNEATLAEIACMLIEAGADVNKTDHEHFTPLMFGM